MVVKRGQVTIFVIIAIVLVLAFGAYFLLKDKVGKSSVPSFADPVETTILSCLEDDLGQGASLLGVNGGSLYDGAFDPGSRYMPFSSHLSFAGNSIPYWYYISGSNVEKQNVPSMQDMENDLSRFVEDSIKNCDLTKYYDEGYAVFMDTPTANVKINERSIEVDLEMDLLVQKDSQKYTISNHYAKKDSNLGSLYGDAIKVYQKEQSDLFLEKYGVDDLRLYAPVDGVDLTCSPEVWDASNVSRNLKDAIELNTLALKGSGSKNDYYNLDLQVGNEVHFLNSKNWPYKFEVSPNEGNSLVAKPVGNQQGLGILGFCYVSYHFVYNVAYPVLVQVMDPKTLETFQFPVVVSIKGNKERTPLEEGSSYKDNLPDLCQYSISPTKITVQDRDNKPLEAEASFSCFASSCYLGKSEKVSGSITINLPQCVNGKLVVNSPGYATSTTTYSSVKSGSVNVILNKEFEKKISFKLDGQITGKKVVLSIYKQNGDTQTIILPVSNKVNLSEGSYNIEARVYDNSSLKFDATTREECVDVPTSIGGAFGITKKQCFTVNIPQQLISEVLVGGGSKTIYFTESELSNENVLEISAESMAKPTSIEQVQTNYVLFDGRELEVTLR